MLQILPNGQRQLFTLINSVVPSAVLAARMLLRFGLIVDRQYTLNSTVASGRSFIAVSALVSGGLGVAIGLLLSWCVAMKVLRMKVLMMFFEIVLNEVSSKSLGEPLTVNRQPSPDGTTGIDIELVCQIN